jgi:hypothetical protein
MDVVDQKYVVEQFSAYAANEPLRDGAHVRRSNCRPNHLGTNALRRAVELVIAIPQHDHVSPPNAIVDDHELAIDRDDPCFPTRERLLRRNLRRR